jgi:hypothetical protein
MTVLVAILLQSSLVLVQLLDDLQLESNLMIMVAYIVI